MPLIKDLNTKLKSIPYGAEDVARLSKMFTDSKSINGPLFIAKQNILSRQLKTLETPNGIYTGASTLLNAAGGFLGLRLHVPLFENFIPERNRYFKTVLGKNKENNRLVEFINGKIELPPRIQDKVYLNEKGLFGEINDGIHPSSGTSNFKNFYLGEENRKYYNSVIKLQQGDSYGKLPNMDQIYNGYSTHFDHNIKTYSSDKVYKDDLKITHSGSILPSKRVLTQPEPPDPKLKLSEVNIQSGKLKGQIQELGDKVYTKGRGLFGLMDNKNNPFRNFYVNLDSQNYYGISNRKPEDSYGRLPDENEEYSKSFNHTQKTKTSDKVYKNDLKITPNDSILPSERALTQPEHPKLKLSTVNIQSGRFQGWSGTLEDDIEMGKLNTTPIKPNSFSYPTSTEILDKINSSDIEIPNSDFINEVNKDLIQFSISIVNNDVFGEEFRLNFRAFIDTFSDTYTSDWKDIKYSGRGDKFYNYGGFDRKISLGFSTYAQSKNELLPMYKKLNYLASSTAPSYSGIGYMRGNLIRLTVGNYIKNQLGIIMGGFTYDMGESIWDIDAGLPMMIKVTGFSFVPIHEFIPELGKRFIATNVV
jgi:hypothetical protein